MRGGIYEFMSECVAIVRKLCIMVFVFLKGGWFIVLALSWLVKKVYFFQVMPSGVLFRVFKQDFGDFWFIESRISLIFAWEVYTYNENGLTYASAPDILARVDAANPCL